MHDHGHRLQIRTDGPMVTAHLVSPDMAEPMLLSTFCKACFDVDRPTYDGWVSLLEANVKVLLEKKYNCHATVVPVKPGENN